MIKERRLESFEKARLIHMEVSELCDKIGALLEQEAAIFENLDLKRREALLTESGFFFEEGEAKLLEAGSYHSLAENFRPRLYLLAK